MVSAHRTPQLMFEFASQAKQNGYDIIIAGAGGAAHLPGMVASMTTLPVIGVPIESKSLKRVRFFIIYSTNAWWNTGSNYGYR